jgi:uncharacterized protein with von Willebrand factor type A (vWA) domain
MFLRLFTELRDAKVPVSLREYLDLMGALDRGVIGREVEAFYYLSRTALVKDERHLDRFDRVFARVFEGVTNLDEAVAPVDLPEAWLRKLAEKFLTEAEKAEIEAMGGFEKLLETLKQRLDEQKGRHQGGSKWIGTAGTSPFGAHGYNPEGVRIGQDEGRHGRAVKVWDQRAFRNLDDTVELGTRNIKVALRRLRRFAREGAEQELDLDGTIDATARQGWLDVRLQPERRNTVKVVLFLDIGGSMDAHVKLCEELFSAAKSEFKHLEFFYFHNCLYEGVWKDNRRRQTETVPTLEVLNRYPRDWKAVFVGDASMSLYEITMPGGSVEHWNAEAGSVWLERATATWEKVAWLNPTPQGYWDYTPSIGLVRQLMQERMYPLTLQGLDRAMRELTR